jgi:hypothetical protein
METNLYQDRQQRVKLQFDADGRAGLFPLLEMATNSVLGDRFLLQSLWAAGRQVFVWRAFDQETKKQVIVKQAAFDFRNPLQYSRKDVFQMRQVLRFEHEVQSHCQTGHMSKPIALISCDSIIPAAKESRVLGANEVFAVEEWVEAKPIYELALASSSVPLEVHERRAAQMAGSFVSFWENLYEAGWLYVDVNAYNLLFDVENNQCQRGSRLRVVDAGSVLSASPEVILHGISPAFATPNLWQSVAEKRPLPGSLALVLPPLAKVLHFFLTRAEPLNGELPNPSPENLTAYTKECREALSAMLLLDASPGKIEFAKNAIAAWVK